MRGPARVFLEVRVVPRAARNTLARDANGALRIHLTAPPVEGAANRALLGFLADRLMLPKSALAVARGERGRDKVVSVDGYSTPDLERRLARALEDRVDKARDRG
jgi:uncharacterized protein YggU (UPF0235/DUF167 family)